MHFDPSRNELPLVPTNQATDRSITIKIIGLGGAGANAVARIGLGGLERTSLAVLDTDEQVLARTTIAEKALIGLKVTRGLGSGGDPERGFAAAEADREKIETMVKGCDMVVLVTGMGGGTGSGAAALVADIASSQGALVIAFATLPFTFEGGRRLKQAEEGLAELRRCSDAVIPLPNDLLLQEGDDAEPIQESLARSNDWMIRAVKSIWAIHFKSGLINIDFATVRQVFQSRGGKTLFGVGSGAGENALEEAIENFKLCPFLHSSEFTRKADRLLVNIIGGPDLTLPKVNAIMCMVSEQFGRESMTNLGAVIDDQMAGRIEICVLGTTDIGGRSQTGPRRPAPHFEREKKAAEKRAGSTAPFSPVNAGGSNVTQASEPKKSKPLQAEARETPVVLQDEFAINEIPDRGIFDKTDRILYGGEDLDVPTYLRRGIKIPV